MKSKRLISLALVPIIAINTYVGYKFAKDFTGREKVEVTTHIVQVEDKTTSYSSNYQEGNEKTSNTDIEEIVKEQDNVSNETDNSEDMTIWEKLHQTYTNSGLDMEQILSSRDINSEIYVSALSEKANRSEISEKKIREELNNILTFSLLYTDLSDEEWEDYFGSLQGTIPFGVNAIDYYYPLAKYVHERECSLEHSYEEYNEGAITCEDLRSRASLLMQERSYVNYIQTMIYTSGNEDLIAKFERLRSACDDIDEILNELHMMYVLQQVSRCLSPEEECYFKVIASTVSEYDNYFVEYRDLAIFIHLLSCDYEHSIDECDAHKCKGLEKVFE